MLTVLLADDEGVILNGLTRLIDWEKLGIRIAGLASDGDMLLDMIVKIKPEIVVSDIRMPKKSGLEVIATCKEMGIATKFIFISGYEEFSYAKEALRYGAIDYLLKPVRAGVLEESVKKAIASITDGTIVEIFKKEEIFSSVSDVKKQEEARTEDIVREFSEKGIVDKESFFCAIVFSLIVDEKLKHVLSFEQRGLLRFHVYNKLSKAFLQAKLGFMLEKNDKYCLLMTSFPMKLQDTYVETVLYRIKELVETELHVRLCMGVGEEVDSILEHKRTCKSAIFASELYFFEESGIIEYANIKKEYTVSFDMYHALMKKTQDSILMRELSVDANVTETMMAIKNIHYGNKYAAINRSVLFCHTIVEKLLEMGMIEGDLIKRQQSIMDTLQMMESFREMQLWVCAYFKNLVKEVEEGSRRRLSPEMIAARDYIHANYSRELSLKELAAAAFVSQNYFSALFKKEMGENYKSYVTNIRMEKSLHLILTTSYKTYEIAEMVGYNNVRRFVDTFKEKYDMTPMDYRRLHQER